MNKKVSLSVLCIVLVSTLCNGINADSLSEGNLSSNSMKILPDGSIYGKQQQIQERLEMQEMRKVLIQFRMELEEHKEVSKELYKKVRFWFAYPISLTPAILVFGLFFKVFFGGGFEECWVKTEDFFEVKSGYEWFTAIPTKKIYVTFSLTKALHGLITGTVAGGLTFAALSIPISHFLSAVKTGWIFNEWNRKKQLEGYLTEDKIAIKSLGTQLFEEELNLLLQEEENKEVRQLLSDILRTKKN